MYVHACGVRVVSWMEDIEFLAFASRLFAPNTQLFGPFVPFHSSSCASEAGGTARCVKRL